MADETEQKPPVELSEEEKSNLQKDIQSARSNIVSKETEGLIQNAKEEAKKEAEKEFATNAKIKELTEQNEKLKSEQVEKEKAAAEKFDALQSKVDELITSKAPVRTEDPFKPIEKAKNEVDRMSPEQVNDIESASARAFFGEDYDQMLR